MGSQTSDDLIRRLAGEFRVLTLGGVAVIATGLSRNTFDADIWVEPFSSPANWAGRLAPLIYDSGAAKPVAIGSWKSIERENLAGVIGRDRVIRINGLERPLDIFREPNQLEMDSFDEVWERARPMDDGTRLPDAIDLLVSKEETGRTSSFWRARSRRTTWSDCRAPIRPRQAACLPASLRHGWRSVPSITRISRCGKWGVGSSRS